jgi:hypothetical protein
MNRDGKSAENGDKEPMDRDRKSAETGDKEPMDRDRKSAETGDKEPIDRDRKSAETGDKDQMDGDRKSAETGDRDQMDRDRKAGDRTTAKIDSDQKQKVRTYFSQHPPTAKSRKAEFQCQSACLCPSVSYWLRCRRISSW